MTTVRVSTDEVLVMQRGRVVDHGSCEAIFRPPFRDYTGLLSSCEPEMDPDWLDWLLAMRNSTFSNEARKAFLRNYQQRPERLSDDLPMSFPQLEQFDEGLYPLPR